MKTEKKEVTTNNVFRNDDPMIGSGWKTERRVGMITREIINNAKEFEAKNLCCISQIYNDKTYLHLADDAIPFTSYEHLEQCLHLSTSGKNSGIQGSGMKLSIMLGVPLNLNGEAELLLHNHGPGKNGSFTARLTCSLSGNVVIERCEEYGEFIKKCYGKHYDRFSIYISYRMTELKDKNIIFDQDNLALTLDICPTNDINILTFPGKTIGDGKNPSNKTFEESWDDYCSRTKYCYSSSQIEKSFCVLHRKFQVNDVIFTDQRSTYLDSQNRQMKCNVTVDCYLYPGFRDKDWRLINLDKSHKSYGKGIHNTEISKQEVFFNLSDEIVENRSNEKNLTRYSNDPIYFHTNSTRFLERINVRGSGCGKIPLEKIKKYKFANPDYVHNIKYWEPVVKTVVTLCESDSTKKMIFNELFLMLGGLDPFAYCVEKKNIECFIGDVFDKMSKDNSPELISFREEIKTHIPLDVSNKILLPMENNRKKIYVFERKENGNFKRLKEEVLPGKSYPDILLRYKDDSPVTEEIFRVSPGFTLIPVNPTLGIYDLQISRLSVKEKNKIKVISEERYLKEKDAFPQKICNVYINDESYKLDIRCKVPSSLKEPQELDDDEEVIEEITEEEIKNKKVKNKILTPAKEGSKGKYTDKYYYSGKSTEEVGRLNSSGILEINENHKIIGQIIHLDEEKNSYISRQWYKSYGIMNKIARKADSTLKKFEIRYDKIYEDEFNEKFQEESSFYISSLLSVYLENSKEIHILLDDIEKNKIKTGE